MKECTHLLISGRVQGVGYRWFTRNSAQKEGLLGWCRNTTDGRVEALLYGDPAAIKRCIQQLQQGPPSSEVGHIRHSV
ncbi:MAG: acylphosphatase, partial [Pseudomonadales bacterium]